MRSQGVASAAFWLDGFAYAGWGGAERSNRQLKYPKMDPKWAPLQCHPEGTIRVALSWERFVSPIGPKVGRSGPQIGETFGNHP